MMKDDFDKLVEDAVTIPATRTNVRMEEIATKYGIGTKTVYTRFRSIYGRPLKDEIRAKLTPTKAALSSLILNTTSVDEVWKALGRGSTFFSGLFDGYYGVSTYTKAKLHILEHNVTTPYVVTREDTRSIIYSQLLGDGSYDAQRHALRICHGSKQTEYLKAKVAMLCKALPKLPSKVALRTHTQGHDYAEWYSRHLGNIDIPSKEEYAALVPKMTPVGWLLWYLDDGCLGQDIMICTSRSDLQQAIMAELLTYGIQSRIASDAVYMRGRRNTIQFYKTFIEPLLHLVPNCMLYKVKI